MFSYEHTLCALYYTGCSYIINQEDSGNNHRWALAQSCASADYLSVFHSFTQTLTNARRTMAAVTTSAGTRWAHSNAAARKATNCSLMNGRAKVSNWQLSITHTSELKSPQCCLLVLLTQMWDLNITPKLNAFAFLMMSFMTLSWSEKIKHGQPPLCAQPISHQSHRLLSFLWIWWIWNQEGANDE